MSDRPGIVDILRKGWNDAKDEVKQAGASLTKQALDNAIASDVVQEQGARYVQTAIVDTVNDVKEHTGSLVAEAKSKIVGPENIKIYDQIRENLRSPKDGVFASVFKNIAARVMSAAAGIGGWIGATFVNTAFNPDEAEKVQANDVSQIFGSFMSKILVGRKKAPAAA